MQKVVLVACVVVASVVPVTEVLGECPHQALIKQFDETAYMGTWYEYGRSVSIDRLFRACVKEEYSQGSDGLVDVELKYNSLFATRSRPGKLKKAVPGALNSAYSVSFDKEPFKDLENNVTAGNYLVLETDYTNYAIVWSCSEFLFFNFQDVRVLTREREVPYFIESWDDSEEINPIIDDIRTLMDRRGFSWFWLAKTRQNCED